MNVKERDAAVKKLFNEGMGLMLTKGADYSGADEADADVNANFKRVAADLGMNPSQVCWIYLRKHLDSMATFLRTGKNTSEPMRGRVVDIINYSFILGTLLEEEGIFDE